MVDGIFDPVSSVIDCTSLKGLLAKYNRPGPRYTSYPTALQFHEGFRTEDFFEELERTNRVSRGKPLSLYVHLPFCSSVCFYCGCNVTFTRDRSRSWRYLNYLKEEMALMMPYFKAGRQVRQMHWGGGTPTFLSPEELCALFALLKQRFSFAPDAELGIEIDPRATTGCHLQTLGKLGFNRISMGVQDFDSEVQKAINRIQSENLTREVICKARQHGFRSVSLDLIYGLPRQSVAGFAETLEKILDLNPDRISLFNFAYLPQMLKHQKAIRPEELPSPETKVDLFLMAMRVLTGAGYRHIGMDHFAKPEDELCLAQESGNLQRNFQGYTTHGGCDLHAFGTSSISSFGRVYVQNRKNVHEYEKDLAEGRMPVWRGLRLGQEDQLRREIIMRLMCDFTLVWKRLEDCYAIKVSDHFADELFLLRGFEEDGLIRIREDGMDVTAKGRLLIRNICMIFDVHLHPASGRYSKTV